MENINVQNLAGKVQKLMQERKKNHQNVVDKMKISRQVEVLQASAVLINFILELFMLENVLKWSTDSDTNLTVVCRHRWGDDERR